MWRKKAPARGWVVPALLAGSVGYLAGNANIAAFRGTDLSAAEAVALRFPQEWKSASLATAGAIATTAMTVHAAKTAAVASAAVPTDDAQLALLSPAPMVPQSAPQPASDPGRQSEQDAPSQAPIQIASAERLSPLPQASAQKSASVASQPTTATKVAHPRINDRPGYMLSDTQIASIKDRLHLTPDQEQMWPAVEAALRSIAYTRAQQARARNAPGNGAHADETQTAAIDPNAVQGLKSAAVPLILSFNAEQKEEVRNLAHVMGLDQLASQF
ncbi:MAG TPA: hypothetical protein VE396_14750 [Xanthobacteraceae bacterium]|nr:hypothetical protein [Xanthobacteraceae bacterium]